MEGSTMKGGSSSGVAFEESGINPAKETKIDTRVLRSPQAERHRITVRGYDASLPEDVIKRALIKHFSPCGQICDAYLLAHCLAVVYLGGEGAAEKAVKLNGRCQCDVKGCKIVVDKVMRTCLSPNRKPARFHSSPPKADITKE